MLNTGHIRHSNVIAFNVDLPAPGGNHPVVYEMLFCGGVLNPYNPVLVGLRPDAVVNSVERLFVLEVLALLDHPGSYPGNRFQVGRLIAGAGFDARKQDKAIITLIPYHVLREMEMMGKVKAGDYVFELRDNGLLCARHCVPGEQDAMPGLVSELCYELMNVGRFQAGAAAGEQEVAGWGGI